MITKIISTNMVTGIDCSKDYFDVVLLDKNKKVFEGRFSNNLKGFEEVLLYVQDSHVVMEHTGPYNFSLACFLFESHVRVSIVNPLIIRRFSQTKMNRAKTDRKDALMIAEYGLMYHPPLWSVPSLKIQEIRQLEAYLKGVIKRKQLLMNQFHAFEHGGNFIGYIREQMENQIVGYDQDIQEIEGKIRTLIQDAFPELHSNLTSIPGIGPKSAVLMIVMTNGFQNFESHKQVISYFGLAPRIYESGSSVRGKASICKMGMSSVRAVLYMAARSARLYNKSCKELYDRLRLAGKAHRVAMIAVVNKLIKQAFAIAKSGDRYRLGAA